MPHSDLLIFVLIFAAGWAVMDVLKGALAKPERPVEYGFRVQCDECELDVQRQYRFETERDAAFNSVAAYHEKHKPIIVSTWDGVPEPA